MITCIIIEDQPPAQHILKRFIQKIDQLVLDKIFSNPIEAQSYLKQTKIDLVFLDINLPQMSGMDFLKQNKNIKHVILTTAYTDYAIESYALNVIDYLLKPFSFERFSQSVNKAFNVISINDQHNLKIKKRSEQDYIFVKTGHDHHKVNMNEIIHINSDSSYTEIITKNKKLLSLDSLKHWNTVLNKSFCQVHKSFIVNCNNLDKITNNKVQMKNGTIIPIGRAYKKSFIEKYIMSTKNT
jgi:DNA-binding LytR/AlgR family response regulator